MAKQWYVIHTYTGYEDRVKEDLEKKFKTLGMADEVTVLVPSEDVIEIRGGKRRISSRKLFPGYVLVNMEYNEKMWHLARSISGVTGFVSSGKTPLPLSEEEVKRIMQRMEETEAKPQPRVVFEKGESVRIVEGPFANFSGTVDGVNLEKGRLRVMVSIFGRSTPIELEYWQVEKA